MGSPCDLLVLAAFPPELAPLRAFLGDGLRRPFGGHDVAAEAVGIGLPTAAAGAALRLAVLRPRGVVLVGTCGAFGGTLVSPLSLAAGTVVVGARLVLAEPAVARREAAYPEPMSTELRADSALSDALVASSGGGARLADVATTLAVTTDDSLATQLAAFTSCHAEHLETYGVAAACAAQGVPFAAALGVANRVGASGRAEWRQNHRAASAAAIDVLVAWIGAGAPGLGPRY
jgi:nucleoside phosphorylase